MTVRSSMTELVGRLRSVCGASPSEVFHGVTYWTGEQLLAELDSVRSSLWENRLVAVERQVDGETTYTIQNFAIPRGYWAENDYAIRDSTGTEISSPAYTVTLNEKYGTVTFASDPGSTEMFIDLTVYDWNAAAAAVWEQKAAHRFDYINFKAGDHKFDASQERDYCSQRAAWHRARKVKGFSRTPSRFVPEARTRR